MIEVGSLVRRQHGKDQVMFVLSIEIDKKDVNQDKIICTWVNKKGVEKQKVFKRKDLELVVV